LTDEFPNGFEEPCVELECDVDVSEELIEQGSGLLYILDKFYFEKTVDIDPNLSTQGGTRAKSKAEERAKVKAALKIVLPDLRAKFRAKGLKFSRKQLLESLVPCAGKKGAAKELIDESKLISEAKKSKVRKGIEKSRLKGILSRLVSRGPKSFFVKFREALRTASAPKSLVEFVEGEAPAKPLAPVPPRIEASDDPVDAAAGSVEVSCTDPFPVGCDVRVVVEHTDFKRCLGKNGKVEHVSRNSVDVVFDVELGLGIAPHNLPIGLVERIVLPLKAAPPLRNMVRQPRMLKQALLIAGEVIDVEKDCITLLKVGDRAGDDQIGVFSSAASWSFGLSENMKLKVVPARLSGRILSDLSGEAFSDLELCSPPALREKRMAILRRWLSAFETIVIPVHGTEPHHWTLLSIEGSTVSYRDSLSPPHKRCMANANKFLSALGLPAVESVVNAAIQTSDDCGWFICHWIEEHLRSCDNQPKQSQGWPTKARLSSLQLWLKRIIESLEHEREKLVEERKAMKKKELELELQLTKRAMAFLQRRGLIEKVVEVHRSLAKSLLEDGKGEGAPPLDAAFLERLKDYRDLLEKRRLEKLKPPPPELLPIEDMHLEPAPLEPPSPELIPIEDMHLEPQPLELPPGEGVEPAPELIPIEDMHVEPPPLELPPGEGVEPAPLEPPPLPPPLEPAPLEPAPPEIEAMPSAIEKLRLQLKGEGVDVFKVLLDIASVEDLRPALQAHMRMVEKDGTGVCSKCRWLSGCMNCDVMKAWVYCIKVELGISSGQAILSRSAVKFGGGCSVEASISSLRALHIGTHSFFDGSDPEVAPK